MCCKGKEPSVVVGWESQILFRDSLSKKVVFQLSAEGMKCQESGVPQSKGG